MKKRFLAFVSFLLFVGGCLSNKPNLPVLTPHPPAQPVHVFLSPEVHPVHSALLACSAALPEITLRVTEAPPGKDDLTTGDLFIQLGYSPDPEMFHAALAEESFSLVAHPDYPFTSLSVEDVRAVYRGELQSWEGLGLSNPSPVSPPSFWTYPTNHPLIKFVFQPILDIPGNLPQNLYLAPDSEAMQQAIRETPGALGFLPSAWIESDFTIVMLDGDHPIPPILPVLASAPATPEGAPKKLLACLQGPVGQEALRNSNQPWPEN